jgi:hypothetical protein
MGGMTCAIPSARFSLSLMGILFVVPSCTAEGRAASVHGSVSSDAGPGDGARRSDADRDARAADSSYDAASESSSRGDAGSASPLAFCDLTLDGARFVSEWSCGIRLAQSAESSPIYEAIRNLAGGIVAGHEGCGSSPLAWYPDDSTTPTKMIACESACVLEQSLFPVFVASIRPFSGCDDPKTLRSICMLPEAQYRSISESSCVITVAQPMEVDAARRAIELRGETVGSSAAICDSDRSAWYPNDPSAPTAMLACSAACTLSMNHFPIFVAAIRPFLGCD